VSSQPLSGAAVVLRWSTYIHPRLVQSQVCGSCSLNVVGRSGAQVRRESAGKILNSKPKMSDGWSCQVVSGSSKETGQRYYDGWLETVIV